MIMNQLDWMKKEYRRRLRQAAWFFFILGAIFGFIFGLMADGAHAVTCVT